MAETKNKTTTIEIAMETYVKLHSIQQAIKEATGYKLSFDKIIRVIFAVNPEDELTSALLGVE